MTANVNTQNPDGTAQTENKEPEGVLFRRAAPILDHPLIAKVIEHHSVRGAEDFFDRLNWPHEILPMVRAAAQLRQRYPKMWEGFTKSEKRPGEVVFDYGDPLPELPQVRFADLMKFGPHTVDIWKWPLLLRDLSLEWQGERYSSFDYQCNTNQYGVSWAGLLSKPHHRVTKIMAPGISLQFSQSSRPVYWEIGKLVVQAQWAWHTEEKGGALKVYRQTMIREQVPVGGQKDHTWSEIRICVPAFHYDGPGTWLGTLEFRRTIRQSLYTAILSLPYSILADGLSLVPNLLEENIIRVGDSNESGKRTLHNAYPLSVKKQTAACESLLTLFEQIRKSSIPNLETIAGKTFMENPPDQLADLFTNPR